MLAPTLVLQKMKAGYKMAKDTRPINHQMFMEDLKLYGSNKDQLDSLIREAENKIKWRERVATSLAPQRLLTTG